MIYFCRNCAWVDEDDVKKYNQDEHHPLCACDYKRVATSCYWMIVSSNDRAYNEKLMDIDRCEKCKYRYTCYTL